MAPYRESAALGAARTEHGWTGSGPLWVIAACFIVLPFGTLLLPWGDESTWGPMAYLGGLAMVVVMPGLGIAMAVSAYRLRDNVVVLHEHGFLHRWSGRETTTRFDDVTSIWVRISQQIRNGVAGPVVHRHVVTLKDGRELPITHGFADVDGLIGTIESRSRDARLAHVQAAIAKGLPVAFGPHLELTKTHLRNGGNAARIASIVRIETREGLVHVMRSGEGAWATVPVADVANLDVLALAVKALQREKKEA